MGTEGIWIPLVMTAVAGASQYVNNRQKIKRQDQIALRSLRSNDARQKRADQMTQQLIQQQAASTPEKEKKTTMQGYMEQLMRASPDAQSGLRDMSGASQAYRKDAANAALGIEEHGREYANLASRLDAPARQREREARERSDIGLQLGLIGREQEGANRLTNTRLAGVRTNPWLDVLSLVAGGVASGYGGGAPTNTGQPTTAFGYNSFGG